MRGFFLTRPSFYLILLAITHPPSLNPISRGLVMKKKFSFTRYEREILPNFRQKISKAESTEDVKKFFVYTVKELFKNVFEGQMEFVYEEFELTPDSKPHYRLSERLLSSKDFKPVWNHSDLPRVVKLWQNQAYVATRTWKNIRKKPTVRLECRDSNASTALNVLSLMRKALDI